MRKKKGEREGGREGRLAYLHHLPHRSWIGKHRLGLAG